MNQEHELFTILSSMILNKVYCRVEEIEKNYNSKFKDSLFRVQGIQLLDSGGYMLLLECMDDLQGRFLAYEMSQIKPYLRPMSSITEEERLELSRLTNDKFKFYLYTRKPEIICYEKYSYLEGLKVLDWLNSHHFDYRGLIDKELALEAPKDMYIIDL